MTKDAFRRTFMILSIFAVGLAEAYYLPHYGIEWLLIALGTTTVLSGRWIRSSWD
jgi:hypothetical protein